MADKDPKEAKKDAVLKFVVAANLSEKLFLAVQAAGAKDGIGTSEFVRRALRSKLGWREKLELDEGPSK